MKNKQNFTRTISYPDGGRGERSRAQQGKVRRARAKLAPASKTSPTRVAQRRSSRLRDPYIFSVSGLVADFEQ
jgi:hypothetical protein